MRKMILVITAFFFYAAIHAQVKSEDLLNTRYYKVYIYGRDLAPGITISVDCGHEYSSTRRNRRLKDEDSRRMIYNSEIQVLNFFASNGWELDKYNEYLHKNNNATAYIFKKVTKPGEKCIIPACGRDIHALVQD